MNIHIICPFSRKKLLPTLIKYLKPTGIIWHPVCDPNDIVAFENIDESWIKPFLCEPFKPNDMCYRKIDDYLNANNIIDDDYYGFTGDDDMYEPGFFNVIRSQTAKILVYSCYRGDSISDEPNSEPHPVYPLIINKLDDIRTCNVGLGMYMLKGEILKQIRFGNEHKWGDGYFAEELKRRWPNDIKIITDLFVFGNYFQPGRFTSKEKFLKSNWELPKYV